MNLNLKKPLAFFDLETTGMNISTDRIVEISIVKVFPDGTKEIKTKRVNPTIPIPSESSAIHGIFEKDIKDEPTFKQIAKSIQEYLEGCDLGGYNNIKFDIPLLIEEFYRVGIDFSLDNRKIIDAQQIFFMMEPRTLSGAYKFYCNKELEGAHGAEADTLATFDVFMAQIDKYKDVAIKNEKGEMVTPIQNDMDAIHNITANKFADLAGRLGYNEKGQETINFGKYKGRPVEEVLMAEPGYYDWMMKGDFPAYTKKILTQIKLRLWKTR